MANTATSVVQQRNSDMVELLKPDFMTRQELTYTATLSEYMMLPALRFLGAGGLGSAGEWRDLSGNGMDLTYNGNPQMGYTTQGAPYWAYDGVGDYHSHADDAHFDITGTETVVAPAVRGLTCGAWTYFPNAATASGDAIISKYLTTGNQRSYLLFRTSTNILRAYVTTDGSTLIIANQTATFSTNTWYFTAMRFTPSAELKSWMNDTTTTNVAGVPASIFNGTSLFEVGSFNSGAILHAGYKAFPFVCACALSDAQITRLYNRSRGLFGV